METTKEPEIETAEWNDDRLVHIYKAISIDCGRTWTWVNSPALCGYRGTPKGQPRANNKIPANACPICLAIRKYK